MEGAKRFLERLSREMTTSHILKAAKQVMDGVSQAKAIERANSQRHRVACLCCHFLPILRH
jgi:hypothetical protein